MNKEQLRQEFRKRRNVLSDSQIDSFSITIANKVLELPIWDFSLYHIFLSITKNKEVNTEPLLSILHGKDKNVVIPKTCGPKELKNYLLTDGVILEENSLGIPEPKNGIKILETELDVVFIPLLAFDLEGNRVGYGGGYYDTFLKKCKSNVIKIGLSFFEPVDTIQDSNENDIPLNFCVTPKKIYEF